MFTSQIHALTDQGCYTKAITVGTIDPASGVYQRQYGFKSDDSNHVCLLDSPSRYVMSPDGIRYAATRSINRDIHTGWVDRNGTFTDVTAAVTGQQSDFASSIHQEPQFFDGDGNYYYRDFNTKEVRAVQTGQPATSRLVAADRGLGLYPGEKPDGHGKFALPVALCTQRADAWLDSSTYIFQDLDKNMIYKSSNLSNDDCPRHRGPDATDLLPQTDRGVGVPVAKLNGTQIAFLSVQGAQTDLFISDIASKAPKKLAVTGITTADIFLADWR
ncbi:hypothetical protein [Nocardia sp. R7R-8]|uniref:hypothetical protein n=1 Tax=Nocardia sp. R7R-8 TaxID=3459304 RepID=UPI00403DBEF0